MKFKLKYDDSLDVLGVHGVGGVLGMVMLGLFASRSINPAGRDGLMNGGGLHLIGSELMAVGVTIAMAFGVTFVLAKLVDMTMGLRVGPEEEFNGLDLSQHAESAYS